MAQSYNLPYVSTNPSGTGNVIFDQGPSPLEVHLDNLRQFDTGMQRRRQEQQQKLKVTGDLLADVNPDTKGILDSDTPYFQQQTKDLHEFTTQALLHGLDPNTPMGAAVASQLKYKGKQIELDAQASKVAKDVLLKAEGALNINPGKYDIDATNEKIAKFRSASLKDRSNIADWGQLLVPKRVDTTKKLLDLAKSFKPDVSSEIVKVPGGGTSVQTVTEYSPKQLAAVAMQSPDIVEGKKNEFDDLDAGTKQAYIERAGPDGDPIKLYVEDWYTNYLPEKDIRQKGVQYSPMEHQYARMWGDQEKEQEDVSYLVDRFSKVLDGSAFETPEETYEQTPNSFSGDISSKTGVLAQLPLGQATIPRYTVENGKMVLKDLETFPNKVIDFKWQNGQPYVQTAKSQMLAMQGLGDKYKPVDENFLDDLTAGSKNPIKTKEALKKELIKRGQYENGKFSFGAKPTQQAAAKSEPTTATKLTGKIDPSTLKTNQEYEVNGKVYIWNGSKLNPK
jgi:hypothetical protein